MTYWYFYVQLQAIAGEGILAQFRTFLCGSSVSSIKRKFRQSWSKYLAQMADVYNPSQNRHYQLSTPPPFSYPPLQCCDFWEMNWDLICVKSILMQATMPFCWRIAQEGKFFFGNAAFSFKWLQRNSSRQPLSS